MLQHINACRLSAIETKLARQKNQGEILPRPAYSPDVTLPNITSPLVNRMIIIILLIFDRKNFVFCFTRRHSRSPKSLVHHRKQWREIHH